MPLQLEPYQTQVDQWPRTGRHILAQADDETVVVYQAYNRAIGQHAIQHQRFGGDFSFNRMSWVKPNFLWMMYRSGWGTKENQEVTLALRIRRTFFDWILAAAVPSSWDASLYPTEEAWKRAVAGSTVRFQWDPDHHPNGAPLERRAIQLGLRGDVLAAYGTRELLEVIDLSAFVAEQRENLRDLARLMCPRERVYRPSNSEVTERLRLDNGGGSLSAVPVLP